MRSRASLLAAFFLSLLRDYEPERTYGRTEGGRKAVSLWVRCARPSAPPFLVGAPFVVAVDLRRPAREQTNERRRFLSSSNRVSSLSILRCLKSEEGPTNTKTETEKRRRRRGPPSFFLPYRKSAGRSPPFFLHIFHAQREARDKVRLAKTSPLQGYALHIPSL